MTTPRRIPGDRIPGLSHLFSGDAPLIGLRIDGRYLVESRVGAGGMGEVYRAQDLKLHRAVAVKVLSGRFATSRLAQRFEAEAKTLASIDHPGIVPIHDLGMLPDGRHYFAMKFVDGRTFQQMIDAQEPRDRLLQILTEVATVVHFAHHLGVLHRDLKPANVMIDRHGRVFVLDWGLARLREETEPLPEGPAPEARDRTVAGAVLGTLGYMSPEQARGELDRVTERSDVYSLGAVLYHLLTRALPVHGTTPTEILQSARVSAPPIPSQHDDSIPEELDSICRKAMHPDATRRYASADELRLDLVNFLKGRAVQAEPKNARGWWARKSRRHGIQIAFAAILLLAGAIAWFAFQRAATTARADDDARKRAMILIDEAATGLQYAEKYLYEPQARVEELERRLQEPEDCIRRALELIPRLAPAHFHRGRIYQMQGRWIQALSEWRTCLEVDPEFGPAHYQVGRALLQQSYRLEMLEREGSAGSAHGEAMKLCRAAAEEITKAATRTPGLDPEILKAVAAALTAHARGDETEVDRITSEGALRFQGKPGVEDLHWIQGISADRKNDFDRAVLEFDRVLAIHPKFFHAMLGRATARFENDEDATAFDEFSACIRMFPSAPEGHVGRARVGIELGRYASAEEDATRAILLDPGLAGAFCVRALACEGLDAFEKALQDFAEAARLAPDRCETYFQRAGMLIRRGKVEQAIGDFTKALEVHQGCNRSLMERGMTHLSLLQLDQAISDLTRAVDVEAPKERALQGLGFAHLRKGNVNEALACFTQAVKVDRQVSKSRFGRGMALQGLNRLKEAMTELDAAIELERVAAYFQARAGLKHDLGDLDGAESDYTQAIEINPKFAEAYHNRALIRRDKRDFKGARADLKMTLEVAPPDWPDRLHCEEMLKALTDAPPDR